MYISPVSPIPTETAFTPRRGAVLRDTLNTLFYYRATALWIVATVSVLGFVAAMRDLPKVTTAGGTLYVFRLP